MFPLFLALIFVVSGHCVVAASSSSTATATTVIAPDPAPIATALIRNAQKALSYVKPSQRDDSFIAPEDSAIMLAVRPLEEPYVTILASCKDMSAYSERMPTSLRGQIYKILSRIGDGHSYTRDKKSNKPGLPLDGRVIIESYNVPSSRSTDYDWQPWTADLSLTCYSKELELSNHQDKKEVTESKTSSSSSSAST